MSSMLNTLTRAQAESTSRTRILVRKFSPVTLSGKGTENENIFFAATYKCPILDRALSRMGHLYAAAKKILGTRTKGDMDRKLRASGG